MSARRAACALAIAASLGISGAASAAPLVFDFNGVTLSGSHGNGLGATGGNTAIRNYMNGVFNGNGFSTSSVNVNGALATATYNGENHVKGPTLGTSDGGVTHPGSNDTFIINDNFNVYGNGAASSFSLSFTNFTVFSLSFDWEIFPDATCPQGSWCAGHPGSANWPDIELYADGVLVWSALATTPAGGGDPQAIGLSGLLNLASGAHTLTIVDWPAEVGIDNLRISGCANLPDNTPRGGTNADSVTPPHCTPLETPEPPSLALVALALWVAAAGIGRARVTGARRPD
jgi:hypothetical protein